MKLVFCNSNMIGSWIIRKLTFSKWSHVAIVDGDTVIEAVWPRVRQTSLQHLIETHRDHEFAEVRVDDEAAALAFARAQIGKRYDWRALFGLTTPTRDWERPDQWDCAELAAAVINAGSKFKLFRTLFRVSPQLVYLVSFQID